MDHDKAHAVNYYTTETIYTFEERIGRIEEIAYDLKSSQMTDHVRTKVTLNIENPTTASKILLLLSVKQLLLNTSMESSINDVSHVSASHMRNLHVLFKSKNKNHKFLVYQWYKRIKSTSTMLIRWSREI